MPFDGSGNFNRVMNWVSDAAAAIKITAVRHDSEDDNLAAGLSNTLTKDGQSQPTANIPMNGKKLVNLGAPTVGTDAATKTYVDNSTPTRLGTSAQVITDWNTALSNGWYEGNAAANAPPSTIVGTTAWVVGRVENFGAGYVIQTAWPASAAVADADTKTAMRVQSSSVWSAWFRVRHSETEMNALYARKDTANIFTQTQTISDTGPMLYMQDTDASAYDFWVHANSNNFYILCDRNNDGTWDGANPLVLDAVNNIGYLFGNTIWTVGNDGAGSGLDADYLRGVGPSTGNIANAIVQRDANGDATARLWRTEFTGAGWNGSYLMGTNANGGVGTDNYARPAPTSTVMSVGISAMPAGGVGTYALMYRSVGTAAYTIGQTIAAANLQYSNAASFNGGAPSGTWMCMGYIQASSTTTGAVSLFLRIA